MNVRRTIRVVAGIVLIATAVLLAGCSNIPPLKDVGLHGADFYPPALNPAAGHREVSLRQQHDPVPLAGRLKNATYCDAIEAIGYKVDHAVHQLFCQMQVGAVAETTSSCPDPAPVLCPVDPTDMDAALERLAQTQRDLAETLEERDMSMGEVRRLANIIEALKVGCEWFPDLHGEHKAGKNTYACSETAHELLRGND